VLILTKGVWATLGCFFFINSSGNTVMHT
jgi:hypothetical protein